MPTPDPSSFRARLFRPTRWRLWVQFALLGAFVLIVPILFASQRLLDSGREVLVEHEIIDLSDESNLRVNEFREDMTYLSRDLRLAVRELLTDQTPPAEAVNAILDQMQIPNAPAWGDPKSVRDARLRFLHQTAVGVFAVPIAPEVTTTEAGTAILPVHPGRRAALLECLTGAVRQLAGDLTSNSAISPLTYQPPDGDKDGRTLIAFAQRSGGRAILFVLDLTRYVTNRQRISPRHYYVITDPGGRVFVHPNPKVPAERPSLGQLIPWKYPQYEGRDWFEPSATPEDARRRLAVAVRDGGARLSSVTTDSLEFVYRKGYFSAEHQSLTELLGDRATAAAAAQRLNERMAALFTDTDLRVGEVTPASAYIEVSHKTVGGQKTATREVEAWWKEVTGDPKRAVRWSTPLPCRTLHGQITPLRIDLNEETTPAWLVVASATEELRQDIDTRFEAVFYRWVLPTLGIACLLGIILVMTLTHSVNRLAVAARKLNTDDPKPLPLDGPYEVSQLARMLDGLARDVQERDRQLRDKAARYETILRAAGEGVIVTNSGGVIEEANKAAGRMFGYPPEALIGLPVSALVTNPDQIPPATDSETTGPVISRTLDAIRGKRKDGSSFWLELNLKPVPLRDRVVVTCIFRDVSQRKETEERVRRMNDELEARVRERTAELEEANTKLEVALKQAEAAAMAKDTFVANMSHELRQPLHIIIGFTEALKEEAGDLGAESVVPDLNKILAAAKHLLELINDILDLAKISAGRMELSVEPFPLPRLVGEVKALLDPLAAKNGNAFVVDAPADLGDMTADERRVRQVLINLLSNAFKFTREGSVALRVRRVTEHGREWVRFTVSDTGKGMSAEQVNRLFQRFYQADSSTTRGAGGTGLGLAITQSFCELMGGQPIRVASQEGVGSEFVVTIPLVVEPSPGGGSRPSTPSPAPSATAPPAPAHGPQPADGRTVLVIDDDPMVRELMERFLAKEGFRVVMAESGEDGLRLAREVRPCVVTLDVAMPGSDGWAVLAQLKSDPNTADIPVVMLTIVDDRGRGFALGAADYLTKPIDWQRLGTILRRYLSPAQTDAILVIDDDANNREVVKRHLERDGWKTVEAADGEQGLAAFAADRPGLVLLDLMMPVLDGFGFLDELVKRFPGHRVPVVVLTAKELTSQDFDRLNGRVARIIEKGDLAHLDALVDLIRRTAKKG